MIGLWRSLNVTQYMIVTYDTDQLPYFMVYVCNGLVIIFWQKKIYRFFDQNCSLIASFIFYTMVGKFVWKSSLSQNCRLFEFFLGGFTYWDASL
jgi:hypothetical protein